jgi:hypothetical protein
VPQIWIIPVHCTEFSSLWANTDGKVFSRVVLNSQVSVQSCPCMSHTIIIDDLELLPDVYVVYFCGHLKRAVHDEDVFQQYLDTIDIRIR